MKQRKYHALLYGFLAALSIYIVEVICIYILYPTLSATFAFSYVALALLACICATVAICFRNQSVWLALLRWLLVILFYATIALINGYVGTINWLQNALNISMGSGEQNAAGMLVLVFSLVVAGVSFAALILYSLIRYVALRIQQHNAI